MNKKLKRNKRAIKRKRSKSLVVNKQSQRIMIQCTTNVNRDAVRRENIDGVEHIVISSFTLPDNIVMNGGLYPAKEIAESFHTLERTLAPLEHPQDGDGNFLSASDPIAINEFHVGAFNLNVTRENGRVHIEKFINVQEALKSEKGKRVLDRINELETSDTPRPVHTSVGVFLVPDFLDAPQTNAAGQEFTWVAREMTFDHDAILLDNVGAAQPHQGVGIAVNVDGDKYEVQQITLNDEILDQPIDTPDNPSFSDVEQGIHAALERMGIRGAFILEVFADDVVYGVGDELFSVPYRLDNAGAVAIMGIPIQVERNVTFSPRTNSEGDEMKEFIINALKAKGVDTEGLDEAALFKAYNELLTSSDDSDDSGDSNDSDSTDDNGADLANVVANAVSSAVAPLQKSVSDLEARLNNQTADELSRYAEIVGNSDKFPGITVDDVKKLGLERAKSMAANCVPSIGIPTNFTGNAGDADKKCAGLAMPK